MVPPAWEVLRKMAPETSSLTLSQQGPLGSQKSKPTSLPSASVSVFVCVCVCVHTMCSVMSKSFQPHGLKPARLLCPWYWKNEKWVKTKVAQLCLTLCDPMDYTVHGILQARILEGVPFLFSKGSSQPRDQTQVSRTRGGFLTNWTIREKL